MKTFGDSTKTPGEHVDDRCYILAQFSERSNFDWARDLRAALGGSELKYLQYLSLRHRVQANKELWKRVQQGTTEATIVVIENSFYIDAIAYKLLREGADLGHDVTSATILRDAALCMISHAPVMQIPNLIPNFTFPLSADLGIPGAEYTPETVYRRIGSKFNDATVFAARAHAAFDIECLSKAASTNEMLLSPHRRVFMSQFADVDRVFDNEHPKSAAMLNEMLNAYAVRSSNNLTTRISESCSESNDALQAADFTAGFASEIMMNAAEDRERDLRRHFRKVIFNGAMR